MTQTTKIPAGDSPLIVIDSIDEDVRIKGADQSQIVISSEDAVAYELHDEARAADKAAGDKSADGNSGDKAADASSSDEIHMRQVVTISALHGDSILEVPTNASLRIGRINGDTNIRGVRGNIDIDTVAEDLNASRIGSMTVSSVIGDLSVKRSQGSINIASVGEDVFCIDIEGNVDVKADGDLVLQGITGNIQARTGEDATLRLPIVNGQAIHVEAGEDITCFLPDDTNASIALRSGNRTLRVRGWQVPNPPEEEVYSFTLGEGGSAIELNAGADISLVSSKYDPAKKPWIDYDIDFDFGPGFKFHFDSDSGLNSEQFTNVFSEKVQAKVQNAMRKAEEQIENALSHAESRIARAEEMAAEFENRWSGRGSRKRGNWSPKDDPGVDRRRRENRRRRNRDESGGSKRGRSRHGGSKHDGSRSGVSEQRGFDVDVEFTNAAAGSSSSTPKAPTAKAPVTEQERLMVLRMVEQGKISVEQAEKLLSAMGS